MTSARAGKLGWITLSLLALLALFATASLFGMGAFVVGY